MAIVVSGVFTWIVAGTSVWLFPAADSLARDAPPSGWAWIIVLAGALGYLPWMLALRDDPREAHGRATGWSVPASLVCQATASVLAAMVIHRDYFTLLFQTGVIHYILLVRVAPSLSSRHFFRFMDRLYVFSLGIIAFFLVWIALMGYAIAIRSEPRWIPAIAYNIVNFLLCGLLYITTLNLHRKSKRELCVMPDQLMIDHLDITPLFNPASLPIARYILSKETSSRLTCQDAQKLLGKDQSRCDACSKATLCPQYKYLYNRIHEIKR
ncbi:MAG: hypothetical protein JXM71_06345, partial [Spirochaetales bacterium]|nr:hypothetical protein [Spirochaetales bacterium]